MWEPVAWPYGRRGLRAPADRGCVGGACGLLPTAGASAGPAGPPADRGCVGERRAGRVLAREAPPPRGGGGPTRGGGGGARRRTGGAPPGSLRPLPRIPLRPCARVAARRRCGTSPGPAKGGVRPPSGCADDGAGAAPEGSRRADRLASGRESRPGAFLPYAHTEPSSMRNVSGDPCGAEFREEFHGGDLITRGTGFPVPTSRANPRGALGGRPARDSGFAGRRDGNYG